MLFQILHRLSKLFICPAAPARLFEDDGYRFGFEKGNYNWLEISISGNKTIVKRTGNFRQKLYEINDQVERVE